MDTVILGRYLIKRNYALACKLYLSLPARVEPTKMTTYIYIIKSSTKSYLNAVLFLKLRTLQPFWRQLFLNIHNLNHRANVNILIEKLYD